MLPDWKGGCPIIRPLPIHCVRSANRQSWGQAPPRLVGKPLTSRKRYRRILNSSLEGLVHGWRKVQILGSCRRDPGQGPQPFLLRTPGRSPVRSRPGSSPLHSTLALLNSVHQVLSPSEMPGNCLPSLPLPCTIITLIAHSKRVSGHPEKEVQEAAVVDSTRPCSASTIFAGPVSRASIVATASTPPPNTRMM